MKGFQLEIKGNWGHFKRPETNNNPLSFDIMPKTAFIGMVGAVFYCIYNHRTTKTNQKYPSVNL